MWCPYQGLGALMIKDTVFQSNGDVVDVSEVGALRPEDTFVVRFCPIAVA